MPDQTEDSRITLHDNQVDPTWLELTIEDLWDAVKKVRARRGPRSQQYTLQFQATTVVVLIQRVEP